MTWEVRAVDKTGTLVSVVDGVTVERSVDELNGGESVTLTIPTLHADATYLDLFEHEVQLWRTDIGEVLTDDAGVELTTESGELLTTEGPSLYGWYTPAILDADRSGDNDTLTVQCDSLFRYFHDVVVGGALPNHITSPHADAALVGAVPASWTVTSNVEDAAIVDNNATFWDVPKALQLNNSEAGQDAYAYQRYTVTSDMVGVPMFAAAEVYIADDDGLGVNPPPWGGAAYNQRGLMIHRIDATTGAVLSEPQVARITDGTARNQVVELFTSGVLPASTNEMIEVRLYSPDAWIVWRYAHLRDDRAVSADRVDKSVAVTSLVDIAQNTALGWYDHNIGTDVVDLGETITTSWPWWRRDIPGEQIEDLADTFEFAMDFPVLTAGLAERNVKVRATLGTDRTAAVTLTKEDFVGWGLGMSRSATANRVIRQGNGSGAARMERWEEDLLSLGGHVRAVLTFGTPGELLATLRDTAEEELDRRKGKPQLPRARIVGDLAKTIRAGDMVAVDLNHGWAQYLGIARVMKVELDGASLVASLDLEPV